MNWLAPIGFLGLLGLLALIIIYVIKPNYQTKIVSSTYIWRLSLKYKRKRIPINKLNNLLLFIAQALILTICGLLLAEPVLASDQRAKENERIIIIDASASMLLSDGSTTRFDRAVDGARELAEATVADGGLVSVILADSEPYFVGQRVSSEGIDTLLGDIKALLVGDTECTYGSADIDAAFTLAEEVLRYNETAAVHLFTATSFIEKNNVTVENVAKEGEWNAAILGCTAEFNKNNHIEVTADVGVFGRTDLVSVHCKVHSPNGKAQPIIAEKTEFFDPTEEEKSIVFTTDDFGGAPLYSYDYIEVYVSVKDSFPVDNSFILYGGQKQKIRIQYASSMPNNFFSGIFRSLRETMKGKWDIEFVEKRSEEQGATEGFDLYIFEHKMPDVIPTDGVVLLVDPTTAPEGSGLIIKDVHSVNPDSTLASGVTHDLMNFIDPGRITIAKYSEIISDDGYDELAFYQGNPVILLKEADTKVIVWAFDLNYSNIIAMPDFSFLVYNLFGYFVPTTFDSTSVEIGDTVELTARGTELKASGGGNEMTFEGKNGSIEITVPGTYTVTQRPMQGDYLIIENFFARIPSSESDVTKEIDSLPLLEVEKSAVEEYRDLMLYFAIALVALMFAEWYLQSKKNY